MVSVESGENDGEKDPKIFFEFCEVATRLDFCQLLTTMTPSPVSLLPTLSATSLNNDLVYSHADHATSKDDAY